MSAFVSRLARVPTFAWILMGVLGAAVGVIAAASRPAEAKDPVAALHAAHPEWHMTADPDGRGAYFSVEPKTQTELWLLPVGEGREGQWAGIVRVRVDPNREPPAGATPCRGGVWLFGDSAMAERAASTLTH